MKQFFKQVFATAVGLLIAAGICFFFLVLVAVAVGRGMKGGSVEPIEENSVLHLHLHGDLVDKARPMDFDFLTTSPLASKERSLGLYELTKALKLAAKDTRIKGIYLELHDLEGGWASLETLRRSLTEFTAAGKFLVAYGETMSERTYYLATAAPEVYLQPNGEIEFNGLAVEEVFLKGLFQKLEVQPRIFRVGRFKAAIEPLILDKMSDENRAQNKALADDIWAVARGGYRKEGRISDQDIDRMVSELQITSSSEAAEAGLITRVAFEDEVLDILREKTVGKDEELKLVTPGQLLREPRASTPKAKEKIAVIFAQGEISSGTGDEDSIGSDSFVEALEEARTDEDVKAIVVRINSPGGDALASDVMWRELQVTDKEIPVVASMGDVAASGGYYMAAGARHIFAEAGTITGSIGVFGILMDTQAFFKNKLGVNFDRVVTHPYADIGNSNRPMAELEAKKIQGSVDRVYGRFLEIVKQSRKLPEDVDAGTFAEGRVWSGTRAKDLKLVDEIGGLDSAISKAAELAEIKDYELDIYPRDVPPIERILELVSGETARALLRGTPLENVKHSFSRLPPMRSGVFARLPFDLRVK